MLAVPRAVDDRQPPAARPLAQLVQPGFVLRQLALVAEAELLEALGVVPEPAAELRARREVARPFVDSSLPAADAAGPDTVDQDAVAVIGLGRVVDPL